jgi:hypothetical protein
LANRPGPKLSAFNASTAAASVAVSRRICQVDEVDMDEPERRRHLRYSPATKKATAQKATAITTRD